MSLRGLKEAVAGLKLIDKAAILLQGQRAFMLGLPGREVQNPYKEGKAQIIWQEGWEEARRKWQTNSRAGGKYANS